MLLSFPANVDLQTPLSRGSLCAQQMFGLAGGGICTYITVYWDLEWDSQLMIQPLEFNNCHSLPTWEGHTEFTYLVANAYVS